VYLKLYRPLVRIKIVKKSHNTRMEEQGERGVIPPSLLDLGSRWRGE
jgi:hypothetical protein